MAILWAGMDPCSRRGLVRMIDLDMLFEAVALNSGVAAY